MTTTVPISNESMARAITRRTLRETAERQREATSRAVRRYAPTRQRRGPLFRAGVRFIDDCLRGRVLAREVLGAGKAALASWIFWEVQGEPPRPAVRLATLDGRCGSLTETDLVRVSQHALQRLFQRLRTTDPARVMRELLPAALSAAQLYAQARAHGERYAVHLRVPTGEGEAALVWEDAGFLVTTWIHHDSMNDQRCSQWGLAVAQDHLLCA